VLQVIKWKQEAVKCHSQDDLAHMFYLNRGAELVIKKMPVILSIIHFYKIGSSALNSQDGLNSYKLQFQVWGASNS